MANIIRPAAGSVAAYTTCGFTATDFNSLANGSIAIMPTGAAIDNTVNLDDYFDVSFSLVNGGTGITVGGSFFSLYLLPLNQDASTYGDGLTTGSVLPAAVPYWLANCGVNKGASSATLTGTFMFVPLPAVKFILGIANNLGAALNAAAAATVKYRTWNINGNG